MSESAQDRLASSGRRQAARDLMPLVYEELRRLAAHRLAEWSPGQTLQPTALVHEAYLRLIDGGGHEWDNRGHFFTAAAEAIRRTLVDHARRNGRLKRGGGWRRLDLTAAEPLATPDVREDLIALDDALTRLAASYPQAAHLVQLRYFAGLSIPDAAETLGISPRTADRLWAFARAWLLRELGGDDTSNG